MYLLSQWNIEIRKWMQLTLTCCTNHFLILAQCVAANILRRWASQMIHSEWTAVKPPIKASAQVWLWAYFLYCEMLEMTLKVRNVFKCLQEYHKCFFFVCEYKRISLFYGKYLFLDAIESRMEQIQMNGTHGCEYHHNYTDCLYFLYLQFCIRCHMS